MNSKNITKDKKHKEVSRNNVGIPSLGEKEAFN